VIRFVDLRSADVGFTFAFFDTIPDRFVELDFEQAWNTWTELEDAWNRCTGAKQSLARFQSLLPSWVPT
jgi:hypothetical protein